MINVLPIHAGFLENFKYDFVAGHAEQPKYVFKNFGCWVLFDLIYKNTLNVKFQKHLAEKAAPVIEFLKQRTG